MLIAIVTIGSRGDVQPYVALGRGLHGAGHRVRVVTHERFAGFVRDRGLDFAPLAGDPRAIVESPEGQAVLSGGRNPVTFARHIRRLAAPLVEQFARDMLAACADVDALITAPLPFFAVSSVAEKRGIFCCGAYLQPVTPTRRFAQFAVPARLRLGGTLNRLSFQIVDALTWQLFRPLTNRYRREKLGLPPLPLRGSLVQAGERFPILYGYSPLVVPRPPDWGDEVAVTGYWFLDRPEGWQPPAELAAFLAAGPPPVYVGFGSMSSGDPVETTRLVLRALDMAGRRGIVLTGWRGLSRAGLPASVYAVEDVPHDWLFPRMAAVVHHGGAGTTGAALRFGVPSIVVPTFVDQPFWAERVHALEASPPPIPRGTLSAERLASAIRLATTSPRIRARAVEIGRIIRAEDGVARAVDAFERFYAAFYGASPGPDGTLRA